MLKASLKGLMQRKLRLALAVIAIVLGVAFVSGSFVLGDSLAARFTALFESVNQNVAVTIQASEEAQRLDVPPLITKAQLDKIRAVDGVAAANGDVLALGVIPFDTKSGKPVKTQGAPQFGSGTVEDDKIRLTNPAEGRFPTADGEVALSRLTADKTHATIGNKIALYLPVQNAKREFTVVGIVEYSGHRASLGGESLVVFTTPQAQQMFLRQADVYTGVSIRAADGVSQQQLRDRVASLVPSGFEAKTGEQASKDQANTVNEGLSALTTYFLLPFGFLGLAVAILLIFNTFNVVVAQRSRELALLRALGAGRGQVTVSVMVEALLVGLTGATLGLLGGIGLGWLGSLALGKLLGGDLPEGGLIVGVLPIVLSYAVGVGVTLVAALIPAFRASRVPPLAAMRELARPDKPLKIRGIVGAVIFLPGLALLAVALSDAHKVNWTVLVSGAALLFLGLTVLSPLLTRPIAGLAGKVLGWGVPGKLGVRNALRNPRRTAVTASALMIGVTLVSAVSVVATSFRETVVNEIRTQVGAEIIVNNEDNSAPPTGKSGLPASALVAIRALPQVKRVAATHVTVDGTMDGQKISDTTGLLALDDLAVGAQMFNMKAAKGELRTLKDHEFVAEQSVADARHWSIGQQIKMTLSKGGEQTYQLVGIIASTPIWKGTTIVAGSVAEQRFGGPLVAAAYVQIKDGADAKAVAAQIEPLVADYPTVTVGDQESLLKQFTTILNVMLGVVWAMLGLAVLIALLGILNTLFLSIFERTRELGMLRAVGLSRFSVTRMIGTESVLMAVFGCVLGLGTGVGLGWAVATALKHIDVVTVVNIPWLYLVAFLVVATFSGVLAGLLPAWRASRLNVLEAIAYE